MFDTEKALLEINQMDIEKRTEEGEKDEQLMAASGTPIISATQFKINVALMAGFFAMFSFSFWLVDF